MVVGILGPLGFAAVADGHEQVALGVEHQARAEMPATAAWTVQAEDHLDVVEARLGARFVEPAARHRGAGTAAVAGREREIDEAVRGEFGVQGDVEHAALAAGDDRWGARHHDAGAAIEVDEPESARPFGDQRLAVRQKRQPPGMRQPAEPLFGDQFAGLGPLPDLGAGRRRHQQQPGQRRRDEPS